MTRSTTHRSVPINLGRHRDGIHEDELVEWSASQRAAGRPIAVDLFSGAGGLGLGLEAAGWSVAVAIDHDQRALATHAANFPGLALNVDMSDSAAVNSLIDLLQPVEVDLVAGGPPCQPFSKAGRAKIRNLVAAGLRDGDDPRKELWRAYLKVVLGVRPRAVLMENVPDMALGDDLVVIRLIAEELEVAGYEVEYRLLDAWKFQVPQHRRRLILQARRDGLPIGWPEASEQIASVEDAIHDLPRLFGTSGARELRYSPRENVSSFSKEMREGAIPGMVTDHMTRAVRDDDLEIYKIMTSKTLYADLPEEMKRYRSDTFSDKYKRLGWHELSRTITAHIAKDGYWYIHPEEHRTLSVREAARIQTFPDRFRFSGTRSDAFRQIGNAVPPRLALAVSECLAPSGFENANEVSSSKQPTLVSLRKRVTQQAIHDRGNRWWLYPGGQMSAQVAIFTSVLDVRKWTNAMTVEILRQLGETPEPALEPFHVIARRHGARLGTSFAAAMKFAAGARRLESDQLHELIGRLTPLQRGLARTKLGYDELVISAATVKNASAIVALPEAPQSRGLQKLTVARVVGTGADAPLRMAGLHYLRLESEPLPSLR